jgi:LacI family transcriptional regulator
MSHHPPRVTVLIDTSTSWGRNVLKGIVGFTRTTNRWVISVDLRGVHEQLRLSPDWRGEGVIARVTSQKLARQIKDLGVPAINVSWSVVPGFHIPQVAADEQAVACLAADHFLERGFHHFGYVGYPDQRNYIDRCGPAFAAHATRSGCRYHPFKARRLGGSGHHRLARFAGLETWLRKAPKPLAVFAWDAIRGRLVADACTNLGLRVPDEVSILAAYDDDLLCETSMPPISGIDDCPEQVGQTAAKLLDRQMRGEELPSGPYLLKPSRIVARQSTDTLAYQDSELTAAMSFIRKNADKPITVEDVLSVVSLSRRSLEQRFLQLIGRSPAAEIRRIHLQRVQDLLIRSELPISRIAAASGFLHPEVLTRAFRREIGISPTDFRKQFRAH